MAKKNRKSTPKASGGDARLPRSSTPTAEDSASTKGKATPKRSGYSIRNFLSGSLMGKRLPSASSHQLTAVAPEIAVDTPPQDSTHGADAGDAAVQKDKGQPSVPPAVLDDDKHTQTILQDAQKKLSNINSIPGPAGTGVNAIGHGNIAMTNFDSICATYLQPLKTFNTVVNGIANASFIP
ncbi:hypothetical protein SCLCIDRAFT_1220434 [Scleroderma citrinum Foug A]|uniref:Uncharacterized protein n=1 Tax=Scleroderma citrinum Foug A TaxID=1036808 RepID=A0A0C2Z2Z8_9AGAM|nr:hypothetical protein SCLCIDRAFT_1220434 [Scleroderma citrinum Foug A]